jgi:hypothetical protein
MGRSPANAIGVLGGARLDKVRPWPSPEPVCEALPLPASASHLDGLCSPRPTGRSFCHRDHGNRSTWTGTTSGPPTPARQPLVMISLRRPGEGRIRPAAGTGIDFSRCGASRRAPSPATRGKVAPKATEGGGHGTGGWGGHGHWWLGAPPPPLTRERIAGTAAVSPIRSGVPFPSRWGRDAAAGPGSRRRVTDCSHRAS